MYAREREYYGVKDEVAKVCGRCLPLEDQVWAWHTYGPKGELVYSDEVDDKFDFWGKRSPGRLVFIRGKRNP